MKIVYSIFKKPIVLMVFILLCTGGVAQDYGKKEILRTYVQTDTTSINEDARLILYADHTYLNFGIVNDIENRENYIWFAYGDWTANDFQITCKTHYTSTSQQSTTDKIKASYHLRPDYRLINTYFEFVCERYEESSFVLVKNKAVDLNKKIDYIGSVK